MERAEMIHKYRMHGTNIVLDVNSGTVHVVDDLAYEILDDLDKPDEEIIKSCRAGTLPARQEKRWLS